MNTFVKKLLSVVLTVVMMLSLSCVAFAADSTNPGLGGSFDTPSANTPSGTNTPSTTKSYTVTFVDDIGYDLTAQPGTTKNTNGDVVVGSVTGVIPEKKIPGITAADAYYEISGWAVKDEDGNLVPIDLETYRFTSNTKVYAVVEDVWTPYLDMKQDRSDWYYLYVRDLSIAGVVNGFPGYVFQPEDDVTWGQALKLIMLATGYEVQEPTDSHWASGYLTKAEADGLVSASQEVDLDDPITRLDVAKIAAKALKLESVSIKSPFIDTSAMPVLELYVAKIVEGSFNTNGERQFLPDDPISRAEITTIIWRINNYTAA